MRKPRKLPAPPPDLVVLTVSDAAGLLRVGESTLRDMVRAGKVPHTRIGRRILFKRDDLMRMLEPATMRPAAGE